MKLKSLGFGFVIFGLFLFSFNLTFTGAVLGVGFSSLNYFAIFCFIGGIILVFISGGLEQKVYNQNLSSSEVGRYLDRDFPGDKTLVLDSSFLINYKEDIGGLITYLKSCGDVVVPEEVLREIGGRRRENSSKLRMVVEMNTHRPNINYLNYLDDARVAFGQGEKAYMFDVVEPFLSANKIPPKKEDNVYKDYTDAMRHLNQFLAKKGIINSRESLLKEAKAHWEVSEADVAVLASAMADTKNGKEVIILEADKDFEEAVNYLSNGGEDFLHYMNPRGKVA